MALYAIGDLHLSLGPADKPMDVFGGRWEGYVDKLRENLRVIGPEDTTVLLGDLSWAMSLEDAAEDFAFMNAIPGRKIILKGNHDYWWTTLRAFDRFCAAHGFENFHVLNNSCFFYGDIALCGTRGWFYDAQKEGSHDEKIFRRELGRLERSLQLAEDAEKYGMVLRCKGYVANAEGGKWIHFDYVPGEPDIREGGAMVTGRICVIGSKLNEQAVAELFGTAH